MKSPHWFKLSIAVALVAMTAATAGPQEWPPPIGLDWPESSSHWSAEELKGLAEELKPQAEANDRHFAFKLLRVTRTHAVFALHREATGEAEQHQGATDFWTIQAGEGTLVLGGEIVDRREVGPGEHRGSSIEGGRRMSVHPGDHVDIPPGVPHHILVEPGSSITYLIIKVNIGTYPWSFIR